MFSGIKGESCVPKGVIVAVTALLLIAGGIKASRYAPTMDDILVTVRAKLSKAF